jgi:hypothetical protein
MPWRLSVPHVPALLFLPAAVNTSGKAIKPDSVFFDSNLKFDVKNLLKFVLYNSRNSQTLSQFLVENFINPSLHGYGNGEETNKAMLDLRFYLIKIVKMKLHDLEVEVNRINRRISSRRPFDDVRLAEFSREVDSYLNGTLDKHLVEVNTLKLLQNSFRRSK